MRLLIRIPDLIALLFALCLVPSDSRLQKAESKEHRRRTIPEVSQRLALVIALTRVAACLAAGVSGYIETILR